MVNVGERTRSESTPGRTWITACAANLIVVASWRLAAAQSPAHEGADTPTPDAAPQPKPRTTFPPTVASPSADAPAEGVSFKVEPYALVISASSWVLGNSSNNPEVPGWVVPGDGAFYFTARQSRFGVRASWNDPPGS